MLAGAIVVYQTLVSASPNLPERVRWEGVVVTFVWWTGRPGAGLRGEGRDRL